MPQTLRDVMTASPRVIDLTATVQQAAQAMRDDDIGDVLVCDGDMLKGIVTDRDIAVRAVAQGMDPASTRVAEICTSDVKTLSPDDSLDKAVKLMRSEAIRRVPIVEGGRPVGVVSLGDVAMERDSGGTLADISAAPPDQP